MEQRTFTVTEKQLAKLIEQAREIDKIADAMNTLGLDATALDNAEGFIRDIVSDAIIAGTVMDSNAESHETFIDFATDLYHSDRPPVEVVGMMGDYVSLAINQRALLSGWKELSRYES